MLAGVPVAAAAKLPLAGAAVSRLDVSPVPDTGAEDDCWARVEDCCT